MTTGFDLKARDFDRTRGPVPREELEAVARLASGAQEVLDVGGGTGRYAEPISRGGARVTVFDRSAPMLHEAGKKGLARLVQGDAAHLPFPDRSFDALLFVDLLHHVADWERAVREMGRVARSSVIAVSPERSPNARFLYLRARARLGKPTGRLDEGVHALIRWVPPREIVVARHATHRVDLAGAIGAQELDPQDLERPRYPDVVEAAIEDLVREAGSSTVDQVETVRVARWEAAALREFRALAEP